MRESVEASNYVNQAILALTYNPLLHDEAYYVPALRSRS
jgi:hypothetical protein